MENPTYKPGTANIATRIYAAYSARLTNRQKRLTNPKAVMDAAVFIEKWESCDKPWLLINGPLGTGKTTLIEAMRTVYGGTTFTAPAMSAYAQQEESEVYNAILRDDRTFVYLDDIGTEPSEVKRYGTIVHPFSEVVASRYERFSPLVITTNLNWGQIENTYGSRTFQRLKELCSVLTLTGDNFRNL